MKKVCNLYFECVRHIYLDLSEIIKCQGTVTTNNGSGSFGINDVSERGVGGRKQIKKSKANISQESRQSESMAKQNKIFDPLDFVDDIDHDEWHQLSSFTQKELEIKLHRKYIKDKRLEKAANIIRDSQFKPISMKKQSKKKGINRY